ncbi:hypothetical protein EMIT0158MI4_40100 [Burkholderia ambifaria]
MLLDQSTLYVVLAVTYALMALIHSHP